MASPEDVAFFLSVRQTDPESKLCFECRAHNPQWCDVWHGIYVCLECSGKHRGLGTLLSFVRSLSMDSWAPEKMALMKLGGNGKARAFFRAHGIADTVPVREKYSMDGALMYKDKLAAEASGQKFNESAWKPPPKQETYVPNMSNARAEPGFGNSRYQGIGAPTTAQKSSTSSTELLGDASAMLSKGWSSLAAAASDAATVAAAKAREINVNEKAKSGWGSLSSWTKSFTGGASTEESDNPFGDMLANVKKQQTGGATPYSSVSSSNYGAASGNVSNCPIQSNSISSQIPRTNSANFNTPPPVSPQPRGDTPPLGALGSQTPPRSNSSFNTDDFDDPLSPNTPNSGTNGGYSNTSSNGSSSSASRKKGLGIGGRPVVKKSGLSGAVKKAD